MKNILVLLLVLVLMAGCSNINRISKTYDYPKDKIFDATIKTISEIDGVIKTSDRQSGVISFNQKQGMTTWTGIDFMITILSINDHSSSVTINSGGVQFQVVDWGAAENALKDFDAKLQNNLK